MPNWKERLGHTLKRNHELNQHGCLVTHYDRIPGLCVHASTTNGTSGIGIYKRKRVYWSYNRLTGEFDVEHYPQHA